jgi:hypothetical protein
MAMRLALSDRTLVEEAVYGIVWLRAYGLDSGMLESLGRASTWPYIMCIRSSSSSSSSSSSWLWCRCRWEWSSKSTDLDSVSSPTLVISTSLLLISCCTLEYALYTHIYLYWGCSRIRILAFPSRTATCLREKTRAWEGAILKDILINTRAYHREIISTLKNILSSMRYCQILESPHRRGWNQRRSPSGYQERPTTAPSR